MEVSLQKLVCSMFDMETKLSQHLANIVSLTGQLQEDKVLLLIRNLDVGLHKLVKTPFSQLQTKPFPHDYHNMALPLFIGDCILLGQLSET